MLSLWFPHQLLPVKDLWVAPKHPFKWACGGILGGLSLALTRRDLWFSPRVSLTLQFKFMPLIKYGIKFGRRELPNSVAPWWWGWKQAASFHYIPLFFPDLLFSLLLFKTSAPFCQECQIEFVEILKYHSVFIPWAGHSPKQVQMLLM